MFFRKKKKEEAGPRSELRKHYRRAPGKKHALSAKLLRADQPPVAGDLFDLSAGGAAVTFDSEREPELDPDEQVRLSFTSLVHGGEVVVEARVSSRREINATVRYGFQFLDTDELFSQLDAYYFKFFNRRRALRVRPALDSKFEATLVFGLGSMQVRINDISADGFGIATTPEKAQMLEGVGSLTCRFTLPRTDEAIEWQAQAVHLSALSTGVLFGAVFLIPDSPEVAEQRQQLADYCGQRVAEMALWDKSGQD